VDRWPLAVMGRHAAMNGRTIIQARHIGSPNRSVQARGVFAIEYILSVLGCQTLTLWTVFFVFTGLGRSVNTTLPMPGGFVEQDIGVFSHGLFPAPHS
jgi:hypothetical protein